MDTSGQIGAVRSQLTNRRKAGRGLPVIVLAALGVVVSAGAAAATPDTDAAGHRAGHAAAATGWTQIGHWPDFSTGQWTAGFGAGPPRPGPGGSAGPAQPGPGGPGPGASAPAPPRSPANAVLQAPLTDSYRREVEAATKLSGPGGSGAASCEPEGVVTDRGSKFFFGEDVIVIGGATDRSNVWRRVYMHRTQHDDPEPTYYGDSIGHWEGDTLVIDTTGIRAEDQLVTGAPLNSTNTHMIERYRLLDHDTMQLKLTIENPDVFTRPWVRTILLKRNMGPPFPEAICWRDRESDSGTQAPNLTPP